MTATGCTRESGTCDYCRDGCSHKPGWFLPGEAEAAAEFMGVSLAEFFSQYLAVDWWQGEPDIFVLSPAITTSPPGEEFPGDPRGACVFYRDERCQIHPAKPVECRERWCGDRGCRTGMSHRAVAEAWEGHQGQIRELLGREPRAEEFFGAGLFSFGPLL